MMNPKISALALLLFVAPACKKNPVDRLVNPVSDGAVPLSSGTFLIYDDEIKTGGGLGLIPGGANQTINLSDVSEPRRTTRHTAYSWNGRAPGVDPSSHTFAGFSFLVSPDFTTFSATPARNLSSFGYTKLRVSVRGSLAANVSLRIEGPSTGDEAFVPARTTLNSLNGAWQDVELTVPAGDFTNVKVFATISLQYAQPPFTTNPGDGGTVYIDDIRYEQ